MYFKILFNAILIIFLFIWQIAFVSALPSWFSNINLILVFLILLLGFSSFKQTLLWAWPLGILLDMYSFSFFGLNIINLTIILLLANFLLKNFLTNRSLYVFLTIAFLVSFVYESLIYLEIYMINFLTGEKVFINFSTYFWFDEFSKIALNMFFVLVFFYLFGFFSKKFKPMFLLR